MKEISLMENYELWEQRVLIFIEDESQSNNYYQIIFNQAQFKEISDTLFKVFKGTKYKDGTESVEMTESDESYKLPDLQTYSP